MVGSFEFLVFSFELAGIFLTIFFSSCGITAGMAVPQGGIIPQNGGKGKGEGFPIAGFLFPIWVVESSRERGKGKGENCGCGCAETGIAGGNGLTMDDWMIEVIIGGKIIVEGFGGKSYNVF